MSSPLLAGSKPRCSLLYRVARSGFTVFGRPQGQVLLWCRGVISGGRSGGSPSVVVAGWWWKVVSVSASVSMMSFDMHGGGSSCALPHVEARAAGGRRWTVVHRSEGMCSPIAALQLPQY